VQTPYCRNMPVNFMGGPISRREERKGGGGHIRGGREALWGEVKG